MANSEPSLIPVETIEQVLAGAAVVLRDMWDFDYPDNHFTYLGQTVLIPSNAPAGVSRWVKVQGPFCTAWIAIDGGYADDLTELVELGESITTARDAA